MKGGSDRARLHICPLTGMKTWQREDKAMIKSRYLATAMMVFPLAFGGLASAQTAAQKITGTPGSPSATTTIQGSQIPAPDPKFGGVIKENSKDSKPWWPPTIVPPKGAPNLLLIMTGDQGYGVSGTFGGVIPTPALDHIAKAGLRYTGFCSTALCSPTRAALITGRNHHSARFGVITELSTGFPGYDSLIGDDNATIGRTLKGHGYASPRFAQNYNTPAYQYTAASPFNQWPVGTGFDYFFGFIVAQTDPPPPSLSQNHNPTLPYT